MISRYNRPMLEYSALKALPTAIMCETLYGNAVYAYTIKLRYSPAVIKQASEQALVPIVVELHNANRGCKLEVPIP